MLWCMSKRKKNYYIQQTEIHHYLNTKPHHVEIMYFPLSNSAFLIQMSKKNIQKRNKMQGDEN